MNLFKILDKTPLKVKVFVPILAGIVFSISLISLQSVKSSRDALYRSLGQDLQLEVQTISKMFERERDLKLENVKALLTVAQNEFEEADLRVSDTKRPAVIRNQISGNKHRVKLKDWFLNGKNISHNFEYVDEIEKYFSLTATVFQKTDSGYVRISTNVRTKGNERALNTYIPNYSPVAETIEQGENFYGRAYVVDDWYITAYSPIVQKGQTIGMLYVGSAEKNIQKLSAILDELKLRKSGKIFVTDTSGEFIYPSEKQGEKWIEKGIFERIKTNQSGLFEYSSQQSDEERLLAYRFFADFELYIMAEVDKQEEVKSLINSMVMDSVIIGAVIVGILTAFILFVTNEGLNRYLRQIERSKKKLRSAEEALKFSENKFRTLFNYSSDEIFVADLGGNLLEVNEVACDSLEYSRAELLKMNFADLKTEKFRPKVKENIGIISRKKRYTYETEHLTKTGAVIATEMKSRLINFDGKPAILSISRNITERKKIQKQIIRTIIETEEKERKRFAADLHDGLSPILSTIRLYSDLLRSKQESKGKETELIDNIEELADMAISSAKEIANNITPQILHDFGLATAVEEFCRFLNKTKSVSIETDTTGYELTGRTFSESVLFQTLKELIHNTIKHAQAKNITIELKNTNKNIYLYYRDDGIGFNVSEMMNNSSGLGLSNIKNKIKTVKGTCDFNSMPGKGMFVLISVGIENAEA
jgi:PAS domain S-box-containing protein